MTFQLFRSKHLKFSFYFASINSWLPSRPFLVLNSVDNAHMTWKTLSYTQETHKKWKKKQSFLANFSFEVCRYYNTGFLYLPKPYSLMNFNFSRSFELSVIKYCRITEGMFFNAFFCMWITREVEENFFSYICFFFSCWKLDKWIV